MRAFSVPKGAPQRLLEESGPSETGTQRTVRDKFAPPGFLAFFGSHLLAMHVAGSVKTSALLARLLKCCALPLGSLGSSEGIVCTPGGAAMTARGIGSIGDGHSEDCEGQVRPFGGSLRFLALISLQCMWQVA